MVKNLAKAKGWCQIVLAAFFLLSDNYIILAKQEIVERDSTGDVKQILEQTETLGSSQDKIISEKKADFDLEALFQDKTFQELIKQHGLHTPVSLGFTKDEDEEEENDPHARERLRMLDESRKFYTEYLAKYYPKAFVIREKFFLQMTPDDIAKALEDIVELFSEKPWFYFANFEGGIKIAHYWEFIVDQCSLISEFLKKARVYLPTRSIFLSENDLDYSLYGTNLNRSLPSTDQQKLRDSKNLFLYMRDNGYNVVHDFYALCFDYLKKLFNEGILLKDSTLANKYYYELEFVIEKLRMSTYEPDYQESMKTSKELIALLKQKLGIDDAGMLEDLFGDDEEAQQMARESIKLGYF